MIILMHTDVPGPGTRYTNKHENAAQSTINCTPPSTTCINFLSYVHGCCTPFSGVCLLGRTRSSGVVCREFISLRWVQPRACFTYVRGCGVCGIPPHLLVPSQVTGQIIVSHFTILRVCGSFRADRSLICTYVPGTIYMAHVAGWERRNLHDLGQVSGVGYVRGLQSTDLAQDI